MIRHAAESDIPAMLEMGRRFHEHSRLAEVPFDADSFRATIKNGMQDEAQVYLVAEEWGALTGMTAGVTYPAYFNHNVLSGQELFWWSEGHSGAALFHALEQWAAGRGCRSFTMVALQNSDLSRISRLYERRGYRPVEHSFMKEL